MIEIDGIKLYFYYLLDIIQEEILASSQDDFMRNYVKSNEISTSNTTLNWKEYENEFSQLLHEGYIMVLVNLFIDEYNQQRTRTKKINGIYCNVTNRLEKVYKFE